MYDVKKTLECCYRLRQYNEEHIAVVPLDDKYNPIDLSIIAGGDDKTCTFRMGDVRTVLEEYNTTKFVLTHNHVSEYITQSEEDDDCTKSLKEWAELNDFEMLDHIIVIKKDESYYSYKEHGFEYISHLLDKHGNFIVNNYLNDCKTIINERVEKFQLIFLNKEMMPAKSKVISSGSMKRVEFDSDVLVNMILKEKCKHVVVCHNHIGEGPEPSFKDDMTTKELKMKFEYYGIELSDSVIVSKDGYYSYLEHRFEYNAVPEKYRKLLEAV